MVRGTPTREAVAAALAAHYGHCRLCEHRCVQTGKRANVGRARQVMLPSFDIGSNMAKSLEARPVAFVLPVGLRPAVRVLHCLSVCISTPGRGQVLTADVFRDAVAWGEGWRETFNGSAASRPSIYPPSWS